MPAPFGVPSLFCALLLAASLGLAACGESEQRGGAGRGQGAGKAEGSDAAPKKKTSKTKDKKNAAAAKDKKTTPAAASQDEDGSLPAGDSAPVADNPPQDEEQKVNLALRETGDIGPYRVASYNEGLEDEAYASARVFYPEDSDGQPLPATTLSGGFTNVKEDMQWLAEHLASHGFIVITFTPTNNMIVDANIWAKGHKGAVAKIKAENSRSQSPIATQVDSEHLAVSGFSMGGAGTIVAVNELGSEVQAAVPICAFNPVTPTAPVPSLFVTGTADAIAVPGNVVNAYNNMQSGAAKALTNFAGMTHMDVYNNAPGPHRSMGRYITAWYQLHLNGNTAYADYFEGQALQADLDAGIFLSGGFDYSE